MSFYLGWLWAVQPQVQAMVPPEAEVRAADRFIALKYGELAKFSDRKQAELDAAMLAEGLAAAAAFSLLTPVTEEQLKLENG